MSDDLTEGLRDAGHDDLAEALERKQLAGQLREGGREDLADQLEAGREPEPAPSEGEQLQNELRAMRDRNVVAVPLFGMER
jgi:hypothetical protein